MTKDKENIKEETPVEETAAEETPVEEAVAEEAPVEEAAAEETPVEETAAEETPVEEAGNQSLDVPFLIGKKTGMTRLFDDEGVSYTVTLVEVGPCYVTQIKSKDVDGYSAVQIGYGDTKESRLNKPQLGHLSNLKGRYLNHLKECKMDELPDNISIGGEINVNVFDLGDLINVSGVSKGKGFAGHMKRHGFGGGRASHGKNSVMRKAGSIGAGSDPSKVWKGTRMAGRMGSDTVTVKNLEIIKINNNENTIFVNGSIPGAKNGIVYISKVL